jgi:hypothetical protein
VENRGGTEGSWNRGIASFSYWGWPESIGMGGRNGSEHALRPPSVINQFEAARAPIEHCVICAIDNQCFVICFEPAYYRINRAVPTTKNVFDLTANFAGVGWSALLCVKYMPLPSVYDK